MMNQTRVKPGMPFRLVAKNLTVFGRHIAITAFMLCLTGLFASHVLAETLQNPSPLGRLFMTPAERLQLETMRQTQVLKLPAAPIPVTSIAPAPSIMPAPITLQGYVKRSDGGKSTVWINQQAVQEGDAVNDIRIGDLQPDSASASQHLHVQLPGHGRQVRLKAGQMYAPESHQILELKNVVKDSALRNQPINGADIPTELAQ